MFKMSKKEDRKDVLEEYKKMKRTAVKVPAAIHSLNARD